MLSHFQKLADYNQWVNSRLYECVGELSEEEFNADTKGFFKSLCGTLNHILVGDLLWMERVEGYGPKPSTLDIVLHTDFKDLKAARIQTDTRFIHLVQNQSENNFNEILKYTTTNGEPCSDSIGEIFTHMVNHQTHHRGQCHHMLNQLGKAPPSLDMIYFFRSLP